MLLELYDTKDREFCEIFKSHLVSGQMMFLELFSVPVGEKKNTDSASQYHDSYIVLDNIY